MYVCNWIEFTSFNTKLWNFGITILMWLSRNIFSNIVWIFLCFFLSYCPLFCTKTNRAHDKILLKTGQFFFFLFCLFVCQIVSLGALNLINNISYVKILQAFINFSKNVFCWVIAFFHFSLKFICKLEE